MTGGTKFTMMMTTMDIEQATETETTNTWITPTDPTRMIMEMTLTRQRAMVDQREVGQALLTGGGLQIRPTGVEIRKGDVDHLQQLCTSFWFSLEFSCYLLWRSFRGFESFNIM